MSAAATFAEAAVRTATPLALAALGEVVTERAGVINISLEGSIIAGALASLLGVSLFGAPGGFVTGALGGLAIGLLLALFVVWLRTEQIITGTALTLFALGLTGVVYRSFFGASGAMLSAPTSPAWPVPCLAHLPIIGDAFFNQPLATYFVYALIPLLWWFMRRTHAGLAVRACGDAPEAAAAAGINVARVRTLAILFGATMGGIAGATLVLAQAGTFAEGMSAGRGFIAIAIVVLGRWHPVGVAVASLLFGAAMAVQFVVQAVGWHIRYELVLMLPYVLTLCALLVAKRGVGPVMLGRSES